MSVPRTSAPESADHRGGEFHGIDRAVFGRRSEIHSQNHARAAAAHDSTDGAEANPYT